MNEEGGASGKNGPTGHASFLLSGVRSDPLVTDAGSGDQTPLVIGAPRRNVEEHVLRRASFILMLTAALGITIGIMERRRRAEGDQTERGIKETVANRKP